MKFNRLFRRLRLMPLWILAAIGPVTCEAGTESHWFGTESHWSRAPFE